MLGNTVTVMLGCFKKSLVGYHIAYNASSGQVWIKVAYKLNYAHKMKHSNNHLRPDDVHLRRGRKRDRGIDNTFSSLFSLLPQENGKV